MYSIPAGRAFLKVGNYKSARQQSDGLLQHNPSNVAALDLLCDILAKQQKIADLEKTAVEWLSQDPKSFEAHNHLLTCYCATGNSKLAKQLVAHYRTANPNHHEAIGAFAAVYETRFGNREKGFTDLAKLGAAEGNLSVESRFRSYVALERGNFSTAIKKAELALQQGDENGRLASYLAMICFRSFRFNRCRQYSALALAKNPALPVPQELRVLCWIVWFPPFMLALAGLGVMHWFNSKSLIRCLLAIFALLIFSLPAAIFTNWLLSALGFTFLHTMGFTLVFGLYLPYIGFFATLANKWKQREIKLQDY